MFLMPPPSSPYQTTLVYLLDDTPKSDLLYQNGNMPCTTESIRIHLLSNTFLWNLNLRKLNKTFKIKKKIGSIYISRAKSNTLIDTTCFMMNCLSECLVLYQISSTMIQLLELQSFQSLKPPPHLNWWIYFQEKDIFPHDCFKGTKNA